jgi:hypothetical protein
MAFFPYIFSSSKGCRADFVFLQTEPHGSLMVPIITHKMGLKKRQAVLQFSVCPELESC